LKKHYFDAGKRNTTIYCGIFFGEIMNIMLKSGEIFCSANASRQYWGTGAAMLFFIEIK
jgi:hypothetical protein